MARDLADWDPRYEDYMGWGSAGPGHLLPPPQPPTRSAGHSWTAGRRQRGLYIKNVPGTMNSESLRRLFSEFGCVESVVMGRAGPDASKPRWAIINPNSTRDAVGMVSALHGKPPLYLSVTPAISPEEKRRQKREKEEQQRFLEEVRRETLAARSENTTHAVKTDRGDVQNTIITTSLSGNITTTITSSAPISKNSSTTTITSSAPISKNSSTTTTTSSAPISKNSSTTSTTSSSPVSRNSTSTTTTTNSPLASTTTIPPDSTTPHSKTIQKPFEASCGVVLVVYRPPEPCMQCGATGQLVCSVCGAWYCGKVCQEAHWPRHQKFCTQASASPLTSQREVPSSASPKVPQCFTMD